MFARPMGEVHLRGNDLPHLGKLSRTYATCFLRPSEEGARDELTALAVPWPWFTPPLPWHAAVSSHCGTGRRCPPLGEAPTPACRGRVHFTTIGLHSTPREDLVTSTVLPSIGHNSGTDQKGGAGVFGTALLQRIAAIRRSNGEALAMEHEARTRRDDALTEAALVVADLMALGVHRSREHLLVLASQLDEPATPRRLAAPAALLARLVCGSGRHANTYTMLGIAGEILARMPAGERAGALTAAHGVTGLARQTTVARVSAGHQARKRTVPVGGWSPGLLALTQEGERRVVVAVVEVGGGEAPTVLVADVPGCIRLSTAGSGLSTLALARLQQHGAEGHDNMLVAISRPVVDMIAAGTVRVEACAANADDLAPTAPATFPGNGE